MPFGIHPSEIDRSDIEEVAWTVIECLAEATEMDQAIKLILAVYKEGMSLVDATMKDELEKGCVPNPHFVANKIKGPKNKNTRSYLRSRVGKNFAAGIFKVVGMAAQSHTAVNVATLSLGTQALGLTAAHAAKLLALRKKHPNPTFQGYIDLCLKAKSMKAVSRGVEMATACIPGGEIAASIGLSAANACLKLCKVVTLHKAIDRMAQQVHFQARCGGQSAKELMQEIFTRRGVMVLCQYDVPALIEEPAGWMALSDKLQLI
jgi:hypothetical protein